LLNKTPNIAVVILAAGASSRMGRPKQLLKWKQTTVLGHAIETAKALKQVKTVVVLGANFEAIKVTLNLNQVEIVKNDDWDAGLGKSIATGMSHILSQDLSYDAVLIMLGDQPLIDSTYLLQMISEYKIEETQIIATTYKNGKQGVPVLFDSAYFRELSLLHDDKGAKQILRNHADKLLVVDAIHDVSDIDTLEEYQALYKANH